MTTKVTVTASGESYPAKVVHHRAQGGETVELFNDHIVSGESRDFWVGSSDTLTVTEEYHEGGFKRSVT